MFVVDALSPLAGSWQGTNGFRLMPTDDLFEAPLSAVVTSAAGGRAVTLTYTWTHPDDGAQDGLLVIGTGEEGAVLAYWIDQWHQPDAWTVGGTPEPEGAAGVTFEYVYAGEWRWQIVVEPGGDELRIFMRNVIPPGQDDGDPAGPYDAMVMRLRRA